MSLQPAAPAARPVTPKTIYRQPHSGIGDGSDAAELAALYGLHADPWQELCTEVVLSYRGNGKLANKTVGISVPRQNGKNSILEIVELYKMVVLGRKVLHTAHEVKTARKAFKRLASFFDVRSNPELNEMVESIRETNGQEAIFLKNGGSIEFIARSKNSGRGFTVDDLVCDEAQELPDEVIEALSPTISAAPSGDPQTIYTGTPPNEKNNGEVLTRHRENCLSGTSRSGAWIEFAAVEGDDYADPAVWAKANPALGIRLLHDTVQDEFEKMSLEGFCRERLGMWEVAGDPRVIPLRDWTAAAVDPKQVRIIPSETNPVALAFDVSPDRKRASIAVCALNTNGVHQVEVVESRQGTDWVAGKLTQMLAAWPISTLWCEGPAASLIPSLSAFDVPALTTGGSEYASACGQFYDFVMSAQLNHPDEPKLNVAVDVARQRNLSDSWAWSRRNSTDDITPLVAATLALHGHMWVGEVKPPKRKRKMVLG